MMTVIFATLIGTVIVVSSALNEVPAPTGSDIVSPDAKLEHLFTRTAALRGGLTEGCAVAPDGSIYFSDIPAGDQRGQILRFDPKTGKTTVFASDSRKSNGTIFDAQGRLVVAEGADTGGRAIARYDVKTGKRSVLADKFNGKPFNSPNDLTIDEKGRIYFTDPRYSGSEPVEQERMSVYRLDEDGTVTELTKYIKRPNGIGISPDQSTLYVSETRGGPSGSKIMAFPLGPDGNFTGPGRTLINLGTRGGCDGLCLDSHGNLYLSYRNSSRPGVMVVSPQGKEVAFIPTGPLPDGGRGLPSNVTFGIGDEGHVLYITVDVGLYRIPLKVKGYNLPWSG